ncbi:ATP-binding protein [Endozoicomonas sp. Mp262]|uniref:ATP-binding protein n=1 Tax=Endozoicomonas sp. Mp262 TaxID=2919499 RepID=UPI0021DB0AB5
MISQPTQSLTIGIDSCLPNTVLVAMAVRGLCEMTELSPVEVNRIELCLVEIVNNAIEHAYENKPGQKVETQVELTRQSVSITVSDWGHSIPEEKLDISSLVREDIQNPDSLQSSGRGIYIVKNLMDDVQYYSRDGKNSFVMTMEARGA